MGGRQFYRVDRHAEAIRSAEGARRSLPYARREIRVIMPERVPLRRQATGEAAVEAARLAKSAGKPVKLTWTREEEFTWAYFRPAGVIDVRSAVDKKGASRLGNFTTTIPARPASTRCTTFRTAKIEFHPVDAPLRSGLLSRPGGRPRIISPASATWMSWRISPKWIHWNFVSRI